jgi:hypothetical protein
MAGDMSDQARDRALDLIGRRLEKEPVSQEPEAPSPPRP